MSKNETRKFLMDGGLQDMEVPAGQDTSGCIASDDHNECKYCGINMDARSSDYTCPSTPGKK
jgi:hypothetical protein